MWFIDEGKQQHRKLLQVVLLSAFETIGSKIYTWLYWLPCPSDVIPLSFSASSEPLNPVSPVPRLVLLACLAIYSSDHLPFAD